jgi:hypothetical protein
MPLEHMAPPRRGQLLGLDRALPGSQPRALTSCRTLVSAVAASRGASVTRPMLFAVAPSNNAGDRVGQPGAAEALAEVVQVGLRDIDAERADGAVAVGGAVMPRCFRVFGETEGDT